MPTLTQKVCICIETVLTLIFKSRECSFQRKEILCQKIHLKRILPIYNSSPVYLNSSDISSSSTVLKEHIGLPSLTNLLFDAQTGDNSTMSRDLLQLIDNPSIRPPTPDGSALDALKDDLSALSNSQNLASQPLPDIMKLDSLPSHATTETVNLKKPSTSTALPFQRPRKRVQLRGKTCIIALPLTGETDEADQKVYLKRQDVVDRIGMWQSQGYDTKGFTLSSNSNTPASQLSASQSRSVFPSADDERRERMEKNYCVSMPNQREWENYVSLLREDKLRALGVSFNEDDSFSNASPALLPMSRHASSHTPPVSKSPVGVASSVASSSHGAYHLDRLSPLLSGSLNPSTQIYPFNSIASQQLAKPVAAHYTGLPTALPSLEKGLIPPHQTSHPQIPLPSHWSPHQNFSSQPSSRATSPLIDGQLAYLKGTFLPGAPFIQDYESQGIRRKSTNLSPQSHDQFHPLMQQPHPRRLIQALDIPYDQLRFSQRDNHAPQSKIINRGPHGHRRCLSDAPRNGLDETESQNILGDSLPIDGDKKTTLNSNVSERNLTVEDSDLPNNVSNLGEGDFNMENSDLDTNQSFRYTSASQSYQQSNTFKNQSFQPHLSKLNINAPDFVLEPQSPNLPQVSAFSDGENQTIEPLPKSLPSTTTSIAHSNNIHSSPVVSGLNVAAPSFTPINAFKPPGPSREFSFASAGPSFKSDASSFRGYSSNVDVEAEGEQATLRNGERIFRNIDLSQFIKPSKRSRAIPIVNPNDIQEAYDESGRITQASGRQKRAKHANNDGDQSPQFVTPDIVLSKGVYDDEHSVSDEIQSSEPNEEGAAILNKSPSPSKKILDNLTTSNDLNAKEDLEFMDMPVKQWEPFQFENAEDAAKFNAAVPNVPLSPKQSLDPVIENSHHISNAQPCPKTIGNLPLQFESSYNDNENLTSTIRDIQADALPANIDLPEDGSRKSSLRSTLSVSSNGKSDTNATALLQETGENADNPGREPNESDHSDIDVDIRRNKQHESISEDNVIYVEPSYEEIDAVIKHLDVETNGYAPGRSQQSQRRIIPIWSSTIEPHDGSATRRLLTLTTSRGVSQSPSPKILRDPFQYPIQSDSESPDPGDVERIAKNARFSPSYRRSKSSSERRSLVNRLNNSSEATISDWDDAVSSTEDAKLNMRKPFFDHRVTSLVGDIVQHHLNPLENALVEIQGSLKSLSNHHVSRRYYRVIPTDAKDCDADDESDIDVTHSVLRLPGKDDIHDNFKVAQSEVSAPKWATILTNDVNSIIEDVKEVKTSIRPVQLPVDIKSIIEDTITKQLRGKSGPITSSIESAAVEKLQLQIAGLESMLKVADTRAEDELKARRATEDALADNQRLLRIAMQEAAEQRESAEETERSLSAFHDERQHDLRRTAILEGVQESLQKTASDLTQKNAALEETLAEYRLSSSQWRKEIEEANLENNDLHRTINALKIEIEDGLRGRQTLRDRFDRLQEDMAVASRDIAREQSRWRNREEETKGKLDALSTKLEAEAQAKEKLKVEAENLEIKAKEDANIKHSYECVQRENSRLEALLDQVRIENLECQKTAARYELELHDTKESAKMELQRTRVAMESEIESANTQVNIVSADLQRVIARLQSQLDDNIADTTDARTKYKNMVEEASRSKSSALQEAAKAREEALQHQLYLHQRAMDGARAEHERAVHNVLEDKERVERHLSDQLALAHEKVLYLQEKAGHLEEKLDIAKSAAHAAVTAVQSKQAISGRTTSLGSTQLIHGSDIPEKISPQALRESIMVLQEQLQERESRIEQFEHENKVDKEATTKLKSQEIEINWLRELLGVRIDELEDVITALSQPSYNRKAVRDAAIRLKANLQMEQQEKERASNGSQPFPAFASLSTLTSSPRAIPLAAAAAWGNWRKARDTSFSSLSSVANGHVTQTPSRSSPSTSGFLSGLLTPPDTSGRQSPLYDGHNGHVRSSMSSRPAISPKHDEGAGRSSRAGLSVREDNGGPKSHIRPETPPLLRKPSYDLDAAKATFNEDDFTRDSPLGSSSASGS